MKAFKGDQVTVHASDGSSYPPFVAHVEQDVVGASIVPAPTIGSVWTNGEVKVEIRDRYGLIVIRYCEPWSHQPQLDSPVLYAGWLVGAATWLMECGFRPVGNAANATDYTRHRCKVCGCIWRLYGPTEVQPDGSWSLLDGQHKPGPCCNNVAMGEQIEPYTMEKAVSDTTEGT